VIEARSVFQYEPAPQPLPIHVAVHSIVYTHIDCLARVRVCPFFCVSGMITGLSS
jgi:hypothetical protein